MKEVTVYGLHIAKKTRAIGIIVIASTILTFVLLYLLIPVWDITGAAVATLLSQLVYWYACYFYSQKVFYVPYETGKITLMLVVGAALSFSSLITNGLDVIPRLIIKAVCLISYPFILYIFRFYEPVEIQSIRGFITKWSKIRNFRSNLNSLKGIADDF